MTEPTEIDVKRHYLGLELSQLRRDLEAIGTEGGAMTKMARDYLSFAASSINKGDLSGARVYLDSAQAAITALAGRQEREPASDTVSITGEASPRPTL